MDNSDKYSGLEPYSQEEREFVENLIKIYGKKNHNKNSKKKFFTFDKLLLIPFN